jgi:hypothetical protein
MGRATLTIGVCSFKKFPSRFREEFLLAVDSLNLDSHIIKEDHSLSTRTLFTINSSFKDHLTIIRLIPLLKKKVYSEARKPSVKENEDKQNVVPSNQKEEE